MCYLVINLGVELMDIFLIIFQQWSCCIGLMIFDVVVLECYSDVLEVIEYLVERFISVGIGFIVDYVYWCLLEVVMEIGFVGGGFLLDFYDIVGIGLFMFFNNMGFKEVYVELFKMQQER